MGNLITLLHFALKLVVLSRFAAEPDMKDYYSTAKQLLRSLGTLPPKKTS